jgi:hypothetical protein
MLSLLGEGGIFQYIGTPCCTFSWLIRWDRRLGWPLAGGSPPPGATEPTREQNVWGRCCQRWIGCRHCYCCCPASPLPGRFSESENGREPFVSPDDFYHCYYHCLLWRCCWTGVGHKMTAPDCPGGSQRHLKGAHIHISLKVHMHEILWFVFHNFLASFNNRQGRGPEFQKFW